MQCAGYGLKKENAFIKLAGKVNKQNLKTLLKLLQKQ